MNRAAFQLLDAIARQHIPNDADVYPQIAARLQRAPRRRVRLQAVLLLAALLLLLAGVVYAAGRSLGYWPGLGVVAPEGGLRVLTKPVAQTRAGVTVSIEKGFGDAEQTVLVYRVSVASDHVWPTPATPLAEQPACTETPSLRLPDGRTLAMRQGGGSGAAGRLVFPPLPPKVSQAVLNLPCLWNLPPGAPRHWQFTLQFAPAPPNLTLEPITQITFPTATATSTGAPPSTPAAATNTPPFTVQAVHTGNLFVLFGRTQQSDGQRFVMLERITVTDAHGQPVTLLPPPQGFENYDWQIAFAQDVAFPVKITFRWQEQAFQPVKPPVELAVNVGADPKPGQTWQVNKTLTLAGHAVTLESVQAAGDEAYAFTFRASPEVQDIAFEVEEGEAVGGGGTGAVLPREGAKFSVMETTVQFAQRPTGTIHLKFLGLTVRLPEKEASLRWSPPEGTPQPTAASTATPAAGAPSPTPAVCLDADKWEELLASPPPLPPLPGKMVYDRYQEGHSLPGLYVAHPDGSAKQRIGEGAWPALSPDGEHLLYSTADGWMLADLTTGTARPLPGDGYHPVWSPDGEQVLFADGRAMYVMRLRDGKVSLVTQGIAGPVEPVGWRKDGQRVLYAALEAGFHLRERDLRDGTRKDLGLTFNNKAGYAVLSPDEKWVAFADLQGTTWGLLIAHPNGSARRLIVASDVPVAFITAWSPDGQWLVVNTTTPTPGQAMPKRRPFVVNPFTCAAYPLPLEGTVDGWGP